MSTRRLSGKNGQIWMQNGATAVAGPTSCTGNSAQETVDGIAYDAYQVWTLSTAGNIPMDPQTIPVVTVGGTGLPPAYTYEWVPLRGKLIFTPTLASAATVSMSTYGTPKLYAIGDTTDFSIDAEEEVLESSAQSQNWMQYVKGMSGWKGAGTAYWKGTDFWSAGPGASGEFPFVARFYPAKNVATEYWLGAGYFNWGIKVEKSGVIQQTFSITGSGPLIYFAS